MGLCQLFGWLVHVLVEPRWHVEAGRCREDKSHCHLYLSSCQPCPLKALIPTLFCPIPLSACWQEKLPYLVCGGSSNMTTECAAIPSFTMCSTVINAQVRLGCYSHVRIELLPQFQQSWLCFCTLFKTYLLSSKTFPMQRIFKLSPKRSTLLLIAPDTPNDSHIINTVGFIFSHGEVSLFYYFLWIFCQLFQQICIRHGLPPHFLWHWSWSDHSQILWIADSKLDLTEINQNSFIHSSEDGRFLNPDS